MDVSALEIPQRQPLAELLSLRDRCVVVTGASRGIGQGIALRVADAGASVIVTGRDATALRQTQELISGDGGTVLAIEADMTSLADGQRVIDIAVQRFGRIDVLVNNAAAFERLISLEMTEKVWDDTIDTNLKGAFFLSQFAARAMITAGTSGRIINILSVGAFRTSGFTAAYEAAKSGLFMVTKSMAKELAEYGIRVNAVAPGSTLTDERVEAIRNGELANFQVPEAAVQTRAKMHEFLTREGMVMPLGRPGLPDDIAKAVLFLASPMGDYVSGDCILVEGGQILR